MHHISKLIRIADSDQTNLLLTACANGDRAAFRTLYDQTGAHLFGAVMRILKDRPLAEEAVQDAYVQIWQNAHTYQPDKAPALAWMVAIARYRSLDLLRRRPPPQLSLDDPGDESTTFQIPSHERSPVEMETEPNLAECMARLNLHSRKAVLLAHVEGYSHSELAESLKLPLGTVKSLVRRGLQQLRDCLDGGMK